MLWVLALIADFFSKYISEYELIIFLHNVLLNTNKLKHR